MTQLPSSDLGEGSFSDRPIFVVGSPRSGTTLMRSMLDAHPNIFCPGWETGFFLYFDGLLRHYEATDLPRSEELAWTRECINRLMARYARRLATPKRRWGEKTPSHVYLMPLIVEVFPRAQFIHMIRNGYRVVKSLQQMPFAPNSVRANTHTWVQSIRAGRRAAAQLEPGRYLEVRYEALLAQPRRTLDRICKFLDEPFSPTMIEFHRPENNSWGKAASPLQKRSLGEYPGLSPLGRLVFQLIAGPMMQELDYWRSRRMTGRLKATKTKASPPAHACVADYNSAS